MDPEIGRQRAESLLQDAAAREEVWHQLLLMLLERLETAVDREFEVSPGQATLQVVAPLVFPGLATLTARATHPQVRERLAAFFTRWEAQIIHSKLVVYRVAAVYGLTPPLQSPL